MSVKIRVGQKFNYGKEEYIIRKIIGKNYRKIGGYRSVTVENLSRNYTATITEHHATWCIQHNETNKKEG